ncbi:MAG: cation-translocating P-type ATPase [candidate division NC10 bacterium]|nr:cation-translocating P-type ATPase [candidate division NC10 bacterium]
MASPKGETLLAHGFDLATIAGLSEREAAERLKKVGYNELPSTRRRSIFAIAFEVVREPMFLLLVACGTIYLLLGDVQEALMLLGFVFVVMGITFSQERKTERALEALRDLSSPRALVIRDGEQKRIAGREVVPGDILVLAEGDRVPADAVLLWGVNLSADESLLTGESAPVRKVPWDGVMEMGRPGGDDLPFVYTSTLIVQGQGIARVHATGIHTEMGKIGKALQTVESEETLLQRETSRLVRNLAIVGVFLSALVVIVYGLTRGHWLNGFLAGIALAMAMLPEEFPVVLTIFLALGAWRISQKRVLTRRMPAVETLGSATVLCVDKTGTLTLNRMSVSKIFASGEFYDVNHHVHEPLPETFHEIVEFSILASQRDPFDPMEKAFKQLGDHYLAHTEHLHDDWTLVHEYPLSQNLLAMSHVWKSPDGQDYVIAAKGAPEAIADLCHLDETDMQDLSRHVSTMASEGLRVLGVAKASFKQAALPSEQHDFDLKFLGLVGLADPVRPTVPAALRECHTAGVRVVMITGDYPGTAQSIARQIGLTPMDECITGPELDRMDDSELQRRIKTVNIFARVVPEQKLRLVNALKANGEIVAMTGDGVNDAPALKSAHIGIAMGGRGTDVAREASALVLLDDDFSSIVQAVKLGRRIFDNLKKAMAYILAIHVPIAGLSLIPVLFKWPLILLPVHIVFLELIIDPACSIVFEAEPEEANVMNRPPRNPKEPLFGRQTVGLSLLQGLSVLLIVLAVFSVALSRGQRELDARALTFTTLVIANLGLIFTNRSWSRTILATLRSPNAALGWVSGGAVVFLGLVLYVPFLRDLFRLSRLRLIDLAISLVAGLVSIMWFEGFKVLNGRQRQSSAQESACPS